MIYDSQKKNLTAIRLKQLREEKDLSHDKLAEILSKNYKRYNIGEINKCFDENNPSIISSGVLKNYEVTTDKAITDLRQRAGYGMNVSYLVMFSDFYNVSVEYLLGLSDIKSTNADDKIVNAKTGLAEDAYFTLASISNLEFKKTISKIISSKYLLLIVSKVNEINNQKKKNSEALKAFADIFNFADNRTAEELIGELWLNNHFPYENVSWSPYLSDAPDFSETELNNDIRLDRFELSEYLNELINEITENNGNEDYEIISDLSKLLSHKIENYQYKRELLNQYTSYKFQNKMKARIIGLIESRAEKLR